MILSCPKTDTWVVAWRLIWTLTEDPSSCKVTYYIIYCTCGDRNCMHWLWNKFIKLQTMSCFNLVHWDGYTYRWCCTDIGLGWIHSKLINKTLDYLLNKKNHECYFLKQNNPVTVLIHVWSTKHHKCKCNIKLKHDKRQVNFKL